ncbi:MAG: dihydrofolate synthase / folylpolyglutamate synthase [Campylobacterota bacterium]|nr:dihydrofolate synthase / folylpolyglutamate synthase [Campylobacterota bacterium]
MNLEKYLNSKPLYYDEIDYTRMPRVYAKVKHFFKIPKIIHIIGTNGKGTTGRFLASALYKRGFSTGHYTSPHILEFNERIWVDGQNISKSTLNEAHTKLQKILQKEDADALSYFEYTTFLAMIVYEECDFVVMEAGLGGEHDATAVFPKCLTLVTPIGYDHEAFLGHSIEDIASTKLNAIQNSAILASQIYGEVYEVANKKAKEKKLEIFKADELLESLDMQNIALISKRLSLAPYLTQNLSLSIAALKFLKIAYEIDDFNDAKLFGRLSQIASNIIVDVGHNVLAAKSIVEALRDKKFVLVYNSYSDKNYKEILSVLKPIVKRVEIIEVQNRRIEQTQALEKTLSEQEIEYSFFRGIKSGKEYLVFGSFSVVETFLKGYYE